MGSNSSPLFVPPGAVNHFKETQYWDESFKPAHDFLLLERIYEYKGDLHIPDSVVDKSQVTVVHEVGPGGRMPDGSLNIPPYVKGQRVFIKASAGIKFNQKDSKRHFILVHESDILGYWEVEKTRPSVADAVSSLTQPEAETQPA